MPLDGFALATSQVLQALHFLEEGGHVLHARRSDLIAQIQHFPVVSFEAPFARAAGRAFAQVFVNAVETCRFLTNDALEFWVRA